MPASTGLYVGHPSTPHLEVQAEIELIRVAVQQLRVALEVQLDSGQSHEETRQDWGILAGHEGPGLVAAGGTRSKEVRVGG